MVVASHTLLTVDALCVVTTVEAAATALVVAVNVDALTQSRHLVVVDALVRVPVALAFWKRGEEAVA